MLYVCVRKGLNIMSNCNYEVLSVLGEGEQGERGRRWCVFSLSTSSLMLALICLGWKLSTRLEYWWRLLCTPILLLSVSCSLILTSSPLPFILSTHTLHSVCSTDFLPPVSLPPFHSPHLCSLPMQLHIADPNFPSTPPLHLSISPSDLALPLPLLSRSLTRYIIQLHSSSSFHFRLKVLPIPSLILPVASPCILLVFSALVFCFLSFSVSLMSASFGLPPVTFFCFSFSSLSGWCGLFPGLCGSQGWWDVKSEVCLCVCSFEREQERVRPI